VVLAGEDDFPRTRLTHSLEVAQVGRELGEALGCDPDVVDAAGLAHDLGHPPFGHNGETALDAVAGPCGGFEGNAQTLRILTRLEAKVVDAAGRSGGLNLSRAVLDATAKYPWPRSDGAGKYGVYPDDLAAFRWLRDGAPDRRRCLEAQVMDWADDVAYSVHDVEDGIHSAQISLSTLDDEEDRAAVCELAADWYSPEPPDALAAVLDELLRLPTLGDLAGYDGTLGAQVALKRATSELTGRFVEAAVRATREAAGDGPLARYAADLVAPRQVVAECALLKAVAARYVMLRREAAARQARQREVLAELVEVLAERAPAALEPALRPDWLTAPDDAGRLRVVVDQVAGLTDVSAAGWHARLTGRR
jgi:dGTPase